MEIGVLLKGLGKLFQSVCQGLRKGNQVMTMRDKKIKLQLLARKYMEKIYGEKWEDRLEYSSPAIMNGYIDGYCDKESEEKTATCLIYNRNLVDILEPQRESIEKVFKLKVKVENNMPKNLIAICDDDLNVLAFIDLNEKKGN